MDETNYLDYARLSESMIIAEATELAEGASDLAASIIQKTEFAERNRSAKRGLIQQLHLSQDLQNILYATEIFSEIQDRRKECTLRNNTLFYEALERLVKKYDLDPIISFYILAQEFFTLLKGGEIGWDTVKARFEKGTLMLYSAGTSWEIPHAEVATEIKVEHLFPQLANVEYLKGSPAYKGIVKGVVRILRTTKEIGVFPIGAVLVANQTTPEFVPAMKKAVAVITDQGGVTSHAAIVSRELKIPCIVGVKNATKVLKDGDMVEVDAEKGMIRIIK